MAANFSVIKTYSAVGKMDGCNSFIEVIIVSFKECIIKLTFFGNKHTIVEKITETMDDCEISLQNKYCIIQRMDDCHSFCDRVVKQILKKIECLRQPLQKSSCS